VIGRSDMDHPGPQWFTVLRLFHPQGGAAAEDVRHEAAVPGIQVLDHGNRSGEVGRQARKDMAQRIQSAGRGRDRDDIEGGVSFALGLTGGVDRIFRQGPRGVSTFCGTKVPSVTLIFAHGPTPLGVTADSSFYAGWAGPLGRPYGCSQVKGGLARHASLVVLAEIL